MARSDGETALLVLLGAWVLSKLNENVLAPVQAAAQQFGVNVYSATHPGSAYPIATHRGNAAVDAVYATAERAGFPHPGLATAIAMAESGGNPRAVTSEARGGESVGLWQIYLVAHPQYTREQMLDPQLNAQAALAISKGGTDWSPWSAYKSGAYLRWLQ